MCVFVCCTEIIRKIRNYTIFRFENPEVYTIFGSENPGSVFFGSENPEVYTIFRSENPEVFTMFGCENRKCSLFSGLKTRKCILFSGLKTLEAYTNFVSENLGGLMFDAILWDGPGGEATRESRGDGARPQKFRYICFT